MRSRSVLVDSFANASHFGISSGPVIFKALPTGGTLRCSVAVEPQGKPQLKDHWRVQQTPDWRGDFRRRSAASRVRRQVRRAFFGAVVVLGAGIAANSFIDDESASTRAFARGAPPLPIAPPTNVALKVALPPPPLRQIPEDKEISVGLAEPAESPGSVTGATGFVPATAEDEGRHPPEPGRAHTDTFDQLVNVQRGDTLLDILTEAGVKSADAQNVLTALRTVFDPRRLVNKQQIVLTQTADAAGQVQVVGVRLNKSYDRDVAVARLTDGSFQGLEIKRQLTQEVARAKATITSSLYRDGKTQGVPDKVMAALIKLFSYDVDFQRELQPGDTFDVMFDQFRTDDGKVARDGDIVFAELILSGKPMRLWRFEPHGGESAFYNDKGESARKALLKTPIDGARLTSGFGMRTHPILGYSRMHRGVDFGASSGTPIMAAGSGTIAFVGIHNGYGKYIKIKHNSSIATAYAHMSSFARGARVGNKVRQGEVIGYVGSTGMATGAHLHYEILRDGTQINPGEMKLPSGEQLRGRELAKFDEMRQQIERKLEQLPLSTLVAQRQ
jgi:murein DD-endopeptidase MepM/ murein hydrolase activator NlpD